MVNLVGICIREVCFILLRACILIFVIRQGIPAFFLEKQQETDKAANFHRIAALLHPLYTTPALRN